MCVWQTILFSLKIESPSNDYRSTGEWWYYYVLLRVTSGWCSLPLDIIDQEVWKYLVLVESQVLVLM